MIFEIDFSYDGFPYRGLVTATGDAENKTYVVKVESDNQEFYLDIVARPCDQGKSDWCFKNDLPTQKDLPFDKNFLLEIGEAIEKYESSNG